MTQAQRDQVIAKLQEQGIVNPSYGRGEFILYKDGRRHLCLKEKNPLLVFFGPRYGIMRKWADRVIGAFATDNFPNWECCRRDTEDPDGENAVWFQFKARNMNGDWFNALDDVINVASALYRKLDEEGVLSNPFNADNYSDANNGGHQGVVVMNEKTQEGFRIWMTGNSIQEGAGKKYIGYMVNHIAQGRCLNVLDDQGNPIENLDALIKDLSANYDDWKTFSQNIQGADNSIDQYKVALGKFVEFATSVRDGVPPPKPNKPEEQQKEPKEMKPRNLIVFGAPGTGKSHKLNNEACSHKNAAGEDVDGRFENANRSESRYERVTFYPTYSYAQFVGTYKPVMKPVIDDNGQPIINAQGNPKEEIAYEFVPGPFLRVLVKALNEVPDADGKKKDWCLVIEEINRANAAAVFGDVFQLLDRGDDGVSEYLIASSEDVKKFLVGDKGLTEAGKNTLRALTGSDDLKSLKIPANMYIWATMNSADQGVFPMDTAFKRRWAFEYLGLDNGVGEDGEDNWMIGMKGNKFTYKWEDFRRYVNRLLALAKVNEDKLMGPFFMTKPANGTIDKDEFESKVLMYLWEDAGKMCRRQLFGDISTYSELIDEWEEKGIEIFSSNLRERDTIDRGKGDPKKSRNAKELYKAFEKSLMRDLNNRSPDKE